MDQHFTIQRVCTWAAPACTFVFFLGFAIADYLVPPDPRSSPEQTAAFYANHPDSIRAGLVFMCFAGGLWIIWSAQMTNQMLRIEGVSAPLAWTQLAMGACACIEFIMPAYFWLTASYRDRSPEMQQTLNDMGWLPFDGFVWTIIWQNLVIGIAALMDKRESPIFPRWYGYLSIWCSLLYLPAGFNVFFKDGPLAWNGAISWWVLLAAIFGWLMATTWLLLKAITRQQQETRKGTLAGDPMSDLARRIVELERKVAGTESVAVRT
jgi:hypothetical protein